MRKDTQRYFTPTASLIRKICIYGGWLALLLLIQSVAGLSTSGVSRNVPALVMVAVAALGFFDSEKVGAVAGIAAGWSLDATSGAELSIFTVICFFVGYFSGYVADRYIPRAKLPFGVCLLCVGAVNMIATVILSVSIPNFNLLSLLWHTLLPQLLLTLVFGVPTALATAAVVHLQCKNADIKKS